MNDKTNSQAGTKTSIKSPAKIKNDVIEESEVNSEEPSEIVNAQPALRQTTFEIQEDIPLITQPTHESMLHQDAAIPRQ